MKHLLSMIKHLFMTHLPIFSRWLWKYVVYIINISLLSQIIGSHFWWYLCSIFSFQPTKYSLLATDRVATLATNNLKVPFFLPTVLACTLYRPPRPYKFSSLNLSVFGFVLYWLDLIDRFLTYCVFVEMQSWHLEWSFSR